MYGAMFADLLSEYSHWGWIETECFFGNMATLRTALKSSDVVTFADPVRQFPDRGSHSFSDCILIKKVNLV